MKSYSIHREHCNTCSLYYKRILLIIIHQWLYVVFPSASVPLSPDQQTTLYRTFVLLLK